jgi:hypothetical protein
MSNFPEPVMMEVWEHDGKQFELPLDRDRLEFKCPGCGGACKFITVYAKPPQCD